MTTMALHMRKHAAVSLKYKPIEAFPEFCSLVLQLIEPKQLILLNKAAKIPDQHRTAEKICL